MNHTLTEEQVESLVDLARRKGQMREEERQQLHLTMGRKAASTRVRRQQILRGQQDRARQRAQEIQDERTRRQKELDDMIASSINRRRQHVNRILQAWKETA